eukprot:CAMPEP_0185845714 /NCGR_PEP_ID=MMETSP1354-20130828/1603_1 /TAXON_ID=708628 /ORGANISM="Erythrolobus madagascarensis, Strain CCMP3276" /LENGTH=130 /DNA_ID=CAMNT_0028545743 /DNA_START=101 /DNA_END=493 /DNA_ORIENTATION=+
MKMGFKEQMDEMERKAGVAVAPTSKKSFAKFEKLRDLSDYGLQEKTSETIGSPKVQGVHPQVVSSGAGEVQQQKIESQEVVLLQQRLHWRAFSKPRAGRTFEIQLDPIPEDAEEEQNVCRSRVGTCHAQK